MRVKLHFLRFGRIRMWACVCVKIASCFFIASFSLATERHRESCLQFIFICYVSLTRASVLSAVSLHTIHLIYLFVIKSIFLHYALWRSGYTHIFVRRVHCTMLLRWFGNSAFLFAFTMATPSFRIWLIFTFPFGASIFWCWCRCFALHLYLPFLL